LRILLQRIRAYGSEFGRVTALLLTLLRVGLGHKSPTTGLGKDASFVSLIRASNISRLGIVN